MQNKITANNNEYMINNDIHGHSGTVRTNSGIRELKAIEDYNTLPEQIKNCNNYRQFKTKV